MHQIAIFGSSGFVGSSFLKLITAKNLKVFTPTINEVDVTKYRQIYSFLSRKKIDVVINSVGFVNTGEAEKERGNKKGIAWSLNVTAAKNIARACHQTNKYLIHISSDAVFPGTDRFPGPYKEMFLAPQNFAYLSWYGYTKLLGENEVMNTCPNSAIIRISYPFGNLESERDFSKKVSNLVNNQQPLFNNLIITPTYFFDLAKSLKILISEKPTGVFHIACKNPTSIYQFGCYINRKLKLQKKVLASVLGKNNRAQGQIPRTRLGGLLTNQTEKILGLKFTSWQEALNQLYNF